MAVSVVPVQAMAQVIPAPAPPAAPVTIVADPKPVVPQMSPERPAKASSGINLSMLQTPDLSLLYFDPGQTYLTPYVARAFENAFAYHRKRFGWTPWDRTTVLLKDFSDYGNAAARASPNNAILFDVAPLSQTYETFSPGERFYTLNNHELTHVATMDVWDAHDAGWRRFLHGKPMPVADHPETIFYNYMATPRVNVPRWYLEGSAVFMETWMAGGLGRGQGGYDEMVFRAKVRDHVPLFSPLKLESEGSAIDFQVGVNEYLYGTRFMSYLALTYSPDKVIQWLRRDPGSAGYYATQFDHVFGKPLGAVWHDWTGFEQGFQAKNLAALARYPLTPVTHLTPHGLGSVSRSFYDPRTNSLIGAFRYPGVLPHIGMLSLATGKIRKLADLKGAMLYSVTSLAYDPGAREVYYTEENYALRDIIAMNVDTGKRRMLLRDARIGDLVVNPRDKAIWGIRHENGYSTLVRIPLPYAGYNQIHTFDYGTTPFDLDISPDGSMISASVGEIDGNQSVRVWHTAGLVPGAALDEVSRLSLPPSTPESFVFAPDGRTMYGTAYYTGVSNVYRFDIATRKTDAVSNASTGLFRPLPQADGSLIVYEFAGDGFTPSRIMPTPLDDLGTVDFLGTDLVRQRPELKTWGAGSPAQVPLDTMVTARGHYVPTKEMKPDAIYPVLEGYKGGVLFGYHLTIEDPLQFHQLQATVSVSPFDTLPTAERFHADIRYKTLDWDIHYWHNSADFYDLLGPVERSRKGDAIIVGYTKAKIYDPPRQLDLFGQAAAYVGLDRLPDAQNIRSGFSTLLTGQLGASYTNSTSSLGAIDHEKGVGWNAVVDGSYAQGSVFPDVHAGGQIGRPLPLHNSSLWLYADAGIAGGPAGNPLGSFYFGSFRNNYVDDRAVKRYRDLDSFPGFDIDAIDARRFVKTIAELNLPPVRFAEVGTASFFLASVRPALFAGVLATEQASGGRPVYESVGGQLDLNFTVALRLPMTLSAGVASGFRDGTYRKTELMMSLKIL